MAINCSKFNPFLAASATTCGKLSPVVFILKFKASIPKRSTALGYTLYKTLKNNSANSLVVTKGKQSLSLSIQVKTKLGKP
jgi:hypothetical protein